LQDGRGYGMIIKTQVKQKLHKTMKKSTIGQKIIVFALITLFSAGFVAAPFASAESFQSEINRLQAENTQNDAKVEKLEDQAVSYEDAINKLAARIAALQGKIDENTKEQKRLRAEIAEAEKELEKQKDLLGQNIRSMYLEGDITTLEMLASSKDLSEFVDKEQYKSSVQDKIKVTLDKIQALRLQLKTQKEAVDLLLKKQTAQQAEQNASRQKQHNMLAYNQAQRNEFNRKTEKNQNRIDELIAAQIAANNNITGAGLYFLRFPGPVSGFNPGAYPHRNAGFSMQLGPCTTTDDWPDSPDGWGYCTRQCVSFAAWAVGASGRSIPHGYGNANDWVYNAQADGYKGVRVYRSNPQPGDVAISVSGQWGHAMYITEVSGRSFHVWEYNQQLNGRLRTDRWLSY